MATRDHSRSSIFELVESQWENVYYHPNNYGLVSKDSEDISTESAEKIAVFYHSLSFDASSSENPCEYPHKPYITRN